MKTFFVALVVCSSLLAGCKDKAPCDEVVDHVLSLMPDELKSQMGDKKTMIARCEEQPVEARECVLAAKDIAAVTACAKKGK